jgi:hypothetical protein
MIEIKNLKHIRTIIIEENFYTHAGRRTIDELDFKSIFISHDSYNCFLKDVTRNNLQIILEKTYTFYL